MNELRFDPTTGDWVVFSPARARRPGQRLRGHDAMTDAGPRGRCPFCPGNEDLAPHEIYAERPPGAGLTGWQVRVVPNKFPALRIEEDPRRFRSEHGFEGMGGCGAHEVIVESPDHETHLANQSVERVERVLRAAQLRVRDLLRDRRFQSVIVFKNHGEAAGTSLRHPHWQVIATPVVPRVLRQRHAEAEAYFDREGGCLHCALADAERADGRRVVAENDDCVAFVPYAAHLPFETWVLPKRHRSAFSEAEPAELRSLAGLLKTVLSKLLVGLDDPAFNLTIDSAPRGDEDKEYFLWHLRILPRLATPAGFELGSGMSINTVLPEDAAAFLRQTDGGEADPTA